MIDFEIWWNSAAADAFRAKNDDMDGEQVRPVWDAAVRAAQPQPKGAAGACSCPSGDGSLRWPCPTHPSSAPAQVTKGAVALPPLPENPDANGWTNGQADAIEAWGRAALAAVQATAVGASKP